MGFSTLFSDDSSTATEQGINPGGELPRRLIAAGTAALFVAAILGPLITLFGVGPYRVFLFRLYFPVYLIVAGWALWTDRILVPSLPAAVWALVAIGAYAAVSAFWATDLSRMLFELFTLLSGVFVAVTVVVTATDERTLSYYLLCVFGLVAIGEVVALIEIFTGYHLPTSRLLVKRVPARATVIGVDAASAWFHNRNNFGFFLGLVSGPLFAYGLDKRRDRRLRVVCLVGAWLALVIVVANGSRIATAAILLSLVVIVVVGGLRHRIGPVPHSHREIIVTIGLVFFVALFVIVVVTLVPNPFMPRGARSLWTRWQLGVAGVELLARTGGIGVGVGNVQSALHQLAAVSTGGAFVLHNWMFYFLSGYGIVGGGLFLTAYALVLYELAVKALSTTGTLYLGLFGMFVGFPVGALGPSNAVLTHSFWVFFGLAAAAAYQGRI